jgi:hypothetical protein
MKTVSHVQTLFAVASHYEVEALSSEKMVFERVSACPSRFKLAKCYATQIYKFFALNFGGRLKICTKFCLFGPIN